MMKIEESLVSGALKEIYDLPGSLFEFHDIINNNTAGASHAGIEFLFKLYGSSYYRHTAESDMMIDRDHPWSRQLLKSYNHERHCHSASSAVLCIRNAVIEKSTIYCQNKEKYFVLYETFRFPDRPSKSLFDFENGVSHISRLDSERSYLYIGSAGSFNYGHWLVDDLPRAKAWVDLRDQRGLTCIILMPSHGPVMDDIRLRSLRTLIDPSIKAKFINPSKPIRVSSLYFATPVSFHPRIKNPAAIHFVRSRAAARLESGKEPFRKLFVARRPPNSRSIVNFDALWAFLAKQGFEMVEPEKYSFADQVTLFQEASIVVGQMGAAMTSTLFCRPATSIIYLAPIGWSEPFYLDLAAVGGQQYNILAGQPVNEGPAHLSDFTIPIEPLYHRLAYMGYAEQIAPTNAA